MASFSLSNHNKFYFAKLETITRRNRNYTTSKTENNPFFTDNYNYTKTTKTTLTII